MLDPDFFRQAAPAAARVTQSTFIILAGAFLGAALDRRLGTSPWMFLGGLFLGMAAGFATLLRGLLQPPAPRDDDDSPDPS